MYVTSRASALANYNRQGGVLSLLDLSCCGFCLGGTYLAMLECNDLLFWRARASRRL